MKDLAEEKACVAVATELGVALSSRDTNGNDETTYHFTDLGRNGGINFTLAPGLNRFSVTASPGGFSKSCLEQIRQASPEQVVNATAHLSFAREYASDTLRVSSGGVVFQHPGDIHTWHREVADDFRLTLVRRGFENPNSGETFHEVIKRMLTPVVGVFAELIGYERSHAGPIPATAFVPEIEGEAFTTTVIRRERSLLNRSMCIRIHGCACAVCGFSFGDFYGAFMQGFIEVHHLEPVSALDQARAYDPASDLIPLCANCHRAIHSHTPPLTPAELKSSIGAKGGITT
jgi:5-methylcytosine-specific restriction protein A